MTKMLEFFKKTLYEYIKKGNINKVNIHKSTIITFIFKNYEKI